MLHSVASFPGFICLCPLPSLVGRFYSQAYHHTVTCFSYLAQVRVLGGQEENAGGNRAHGSLFILCQENIVDFCFHVYSSLNRTGAQGCCSLQGNLGWFCAEGRRQEHIVDRKSVWTWSSDHLLVLSWCSADIPHTAYTGSSLPGTFCFLLLNLLPTPLGITRSFPQISLTWENG